MQTPLFIFAIIAGGFVLGTVARWLLPGERRLSLAEITLVGMVGAGIGATIVNWIFGARAFDRLDVRSIIGALAGAVLVLAATTWLADRFGWHEKPARPLHDVIADGESDSVEFKSAARFNQHSKKRDDNIELAIAKTVAGFLNTDGGLLVIGVNDEGQAVGLADDLSLMQRPDHDRYELWLIGLFERTLGPPAIAFITVVFERYQDADVVAVTVLPSDSPVFVDEPKGQRTADFYTRMGNSTRRLLTDEFADYSRSRWK
jgi:uncharacterized membrane protein YeaQ/YmgE (transglycosylase-associated protein family)